MITYPAVHPQGWNQGSADVEPVETTLSAKPLPVQPDGVGVGGMGVGVGGTGVAVGGTGVGVAPPVGTVQL